jgi:hypothetical protein
MALVQGTWQTANFLALSSWTNPIPSLPSKILDAIDQSTTLHVFTSDDTLDGGLSALIHYFDASGAPATCRVQQAGVSTVTSPTQDVTTWDDGDVWTSIRVGTALYTHSSAAGAVRKIADSSTFGAFAS